MNLVLSRENYNNTERKICIECLKGFVGDIPLNENICENAAWNGHLECLKHAHEIGCPWGLHLCSVAVENGQLECLKYLHKNGCICHEWTIKWAAMKEQLECLKYLYQNRCPGYEKYHDKIKHLLLTDNLEVYYGKCLIVRKHLKLYIRRFIERYYSPDGIGFIKSQAHFYNQIEN